MHEDTPDELVHSLFAEALFPGQTVGREVLGERDAIVAMSRDEIAGFHHHHYRAGNVVVAAAGNVDHDRMVDGIAARFTGGLGDRGRRPEAEIRPAGAVRVLHRPTEQAHLVLGMPGLSRSDPDRWALSVLNHVLGGGMSSRLFQEVREKRGLAYSVYSYRSALETPAPSPSTPAPRPSGPPRCCRSSTPSSTGSAPNGAGAGRAGTGQGPLQGPVALGSRLAPPDGAHRPLAR